MGNSAQNNPTSGPAQLQRLRLRRFVPSPMLYCSRLPGAAFLAYFEAVKKAIPSGLKGKCERGSCCGKWRV